MYPNCHRIKSQKNVYTRQGGALGYPILPLWGVGSRSADKPQNKGRWLPCSWGQ